jgi:hypothetical protein
LFGACSGRRLRYRRICFRHSYFRRDPLPDSESFAAKRIVIGYRGAGFLKYVARREVPLRPKSEALSLAQTIRKRAIHEDFDALVQEYSEHRDFAQNGDIGVWSTREATNFPRLLDAIVRTQPGGLTPVLDSEVGFQIFLRTPVTERPRFAMENARFAFEWGTTEEARRSHATALAEARAYLSVWRSESKRPSDPRYRGNEGPVEVWSSGRGPNAAELALREIAVGALISEPIQSDLSYLVARRVEPPEAEQKAIRVWMPEPAEPDLGHFIATFSERVVDGILQAVEDDAEPSVRSEVRPFRLALIANLKASGTAPERRSAWFTFLKSVESALNPVSMRAYETNIEERVRERVLRRR